jgi:hypothetical protein
LNAVSPGAYRYDPYKIHTRTRELHKYGTKLKVRPQPFQVLQALVEHAGDVVTREEFRQILWPEESFVFEHWLDAAAKALEWVEVDCQSFGTARRFREFYPSFRSALSPGEISKMKQVRQKEGASAARFWTAESASFLCG